MPTLGLGETFPNLVGECQDGDFDLYEYLGDSWGVIFMHPADFTPVCTTELGAAAQREEEFNLRGVKLCGFSCNDASTHKDWITDIKAVTGHYVNFPLFADPTRSHAVQIGVLDPSLKDDKGLPMTLRALFILSPDRVVKAAIIYPASTGRNFDEVLRCLDSLQLTAKHKVATPVDWTRGHDCIVDFSLSDADAERIFGKDGFTVIPCPSEQNGKGAWLPEKHYIRTTTDPSVKTDSMCACQ
mmetsp:Transcript_4032/g.5663  ORF Transcript_4032/g.5663 Transcript_4032/m.5663 type:complete len:242 (-) Transcript_4032:410-1135(-)